VTTKRRREQIIHLQLINKKEKKESNVFTYIYIMENCLDVVGFGSVIYSEPKKKQRQYQVVTHSKGQLYEGRS
jgi:hypothetical protein